MQLITYIDDDLEYTISSVVAVIGRSFGGHVAVLASQMSTSNSDGDDEQFACGIAISPIVDWEAHTSVPAERLLGSPLRDSSNYQKSNLLLNRIRMRTTEKVGGKLQVFHGLK